LHNLHNFANFKFLFYQEKVKKAKDREIPLFDELSDQAISQIR